MFGLCFVGVCFSVVFVCVSSVWVGLPRFLCFVCDTFKWDLAGVDVFWLVFDRCLADVLVGFSACFVLVGPGGCLVGVRRCCSVLFGGLFVVFKVFVVCFLCVLPAF